MSAGKLSWSVSDRRGRCVDTTPLKIKYAITVQKQGVNVYVTKLGKNLGNVFGVPSIRIQPCIKFGKRYKR